MTPPRTRPPTRDDALPAFLQGTSPKEARILLAALAHFVDTGFHGATIPAIARRAGVAAGTIYLYFPSKEALVNALLVGIKGHLARELTRAVAAAEGVRAEFDAIWSVFARLVLDDCQALAFCDLHHHAAYASPEVQAVWDPARQLLDGHFAAGREAGVYRELPPPVLRALMAGALLGVHKFARAGELTLTPEVLDEARESAWAGVARPPAAPTPRRSTRRGPRRQER